MQPPKKYFIVSGVFNAARYIRRCIEAVNDQVIDGFEVTHVIIDDGSTDATAATIAKAPQVPHIKRHVITHPRNLGSVDAQLAGFAYAQNNGHDHDVIIQLDGDDWFCTDEAIKTVHDTYVETGCGATYGDWVGTYGGKSNCRQPNWSNLHEDLRSNGWCFSHLRTFRTGYTRHLDVEDFKDPTRGGAFFNAAYDAVVCLPIFEFAGKDKVVWIRTPLIYYNQENPLAEARLRLNDQNHCAFASYDKKMRAPINI